MEKTINIDNEEKELQRQFDITKAEAEGVRIKMQSDNKVLQKHIARLSDIQAQMQLLQKLKKQP